MYKQNHIGITTHLLFKSFRGLECLKFQVLAQKHGLNLIPETHGVGGQNLGLQAAL